MKSFEFASHAVEIEICGKKYQADVSTNTFDYYNDKVRPMFERIIKAEDKPSNKEVIKVIWAFIDVVLGEGTAKSLLTPRKHTLDDTIDLCRYLSEVLLEYKESTFPIPVKKKEEP